MSIEKLIKLLQKSNNKKAPAMVEVTALKFQEILSVHYYLNGEIAISTKELK